jgi:uncharacterized protein (TIRG00374 family)
LPGLRAREKQTSHFQRPFIPLSGVAKIRNMKKNLILSLVVGTILSAGGLYLAFRNVPFNELLGYFAAINYWWLLPSSGLVILSFILRVLRWQIILGSVKRIGFWASFHPLMIAFMINCVLPGRVGELARPVLLKKNENFPISTGLATVATERAFDVAFLILLFMIVMSFVRIDPDIQISFGHYSLTQSTLETISRGLMQLSLAIIAAMILVSVQAVRNFSARWIMKIPLLFFFAGNAAKKKLAESVCKPIIQLMENIASGFKLTQSPAKILKCIVLSILVWTSASFSYYVFALGCPGVTLSFTEMTAVMVMICMFIALPSVPGYWGLWEAGGIFAMTLFGVSSREAAGFTLANHAIQIFPVIIIGMTSAVLTGVNIRRTSFEPNRLG